MDSAQALAARSPHANVSLVPSDVLEELLASWDFDDRDSEPILIVDLLKAERNISAICKSIRQGANRTRRLQQEQAIAVDGLPLLWSALADLRKFGNHLNEAVDQVVKLSALAKGGAA